MAGVLVREVCKNYTFERNDHEVDKYTGSSGQVSFTSLRVYASIFRRLLGAAASALGGAHASFGPTAYVLAFRDGLSGDVVENGYVYQWQGAPARLSSVIVLK